AYSLGSSAPPGSVNVATVCTVEAVFSLALKVKPPVGDTGGSETVKPVVDAPVVAPRASCTSTLKWAVLETSSKVWVPYTSKPPDGWRPPGTEPVPSADVLLVPPPQRTVAVKSLAFPDGSPSVKWNSTALVMPWPSVVTFGVVNVPAVSG